MPTDPLAVDLWMVVAIIQPFRLDAVTLALESLPGIAGMTVSDCRGFGREKLRDDSQAAGTGPPGDRIAFGITDFTNKVKLEIAVVGLERTDEVVAVIARTAHTGNRGDGKIFTWPLVRAVRVRTLEEGASAI
jgi:nitrogen regulatory protein PII